MTELKEGSKAPEFSLKDKDAQVISLKDMSTKYVVVYFYPKDDTPGCTIEANLFSQKKEEFDRLGAAIIGISGGDEKTKTKFCEKHNLQITLLSDPDFSVSKSYGSFGRKKMMGKEFDGIFRNTFILDEGHAIIKVFRNVNPKNHVDEVLSFLKEN